MRHHIITAAVYKDLFSQLITIGGLLAGFAFAAINQALADATARSRCRRWSSIACMYAAGGFMFVTLISTYMFVVVSSDGVDLGRVRSTAVAIISLMGLSIFGLLASVVFLGFARGPRVGIVVSVVFFTMMVLFFSTVHAYWQSWPLRA